MKKSFRRMVVVGLFALSVGAAGAVLTALAVAEPAYAGGSCPYACTNSLSCPGSNCQCIYGDASYHCQAPVK